MSGSKVKLRYQELRSFTEKNANLGRKAYLLYADRYPFGFLYASPMAYTVAWDGVFDFSKLEEEVFVSLPKHIASEEKALTAEQVKNRDLVSVSFILSTEYGSELVKRVLVKYGEYEQYKKILDEINKISFVRYDIHDAEVTPPFEYSFTAQKSSQLPIVNGELSVKLPKYQSFSEELLKWILDHHTSLEKLEDKIDMGHFVGTISNIVKM